MPGKDEFSRREKDTFPDATRTPDAAGMAAHRDPRLRDCLSRLADEDVESWCLRLTNLRAALLRHFESEERAGCLFDEIKAKAPQLTLRVHDLAAEHHELRDQIIALCALAESKCADRAELCDCVARFCQRIERHESDEIELLNEATLTDLGGQG